MWRFTLPLPRQSSTQTRKLRQQPFREVRRAYHDTGPGVTAGVTAGPARDERRDGVGPPTGSSRGHQTEPHSDTALSGRESGAGPQRTCDGRSSETAAAPQPANDRPSPSPARLPPSFALVPRENKDPRSVALIKNTPIIPHTAGPLRSAAASRAGRPDRAADTRAGRAPPAAFFRRPRSAFVLAAPMAARAGAVHGEEPAGHRRAAAARQQRRGDDDAIRTLKVAKRPHTEGENKPGPLHDHENGHNLTITPPPQSSCLALSSSAFTF